MKPSSKAKALLLSTISIAALSTSANAAVINSISLAAPGGQAFDLGISGVDLSTGVFEQQFNLNANQFTPAFSMPLITGDILGDWSLTLDVTSSAGEQIGVDWSITNVVLDALNIGAGSVFATGDSGGEQTTSYSLTVTDDTNSIVGMGVPALAATNLNLRISESVTAVPVPAAAWLLGSGVLAFAGMRRRQRSLEASPA